jgi:hypothetical protein
MTALVDQYREQGFAAAYNLVSAADLAVLSGIVDAVLSARLEHATALSRTFGLVWAKLPAEDQARVRGLAMFNTGLGHARTLLGATELISGMSIFQKLPRPNSVVPWHQDEAYRDPNQVHHGTTLWLPLDAVTLDSGCLQYASGSHRRGVVPHMRDPRDPTGFSVIAVDPPKEGIVPLPLPRGSAAFHDLRTLHCSGVNRSSKARTAITLHFSEPPVPRDGQTREWLSDIVRDNPTSNLNF